jgi:hypothetical protein
LHQLKNSKSAKTSILLPENQMGRVKLYGLVGALFAYFISTSAWAQANTVYIDQIGNNTVIDMTQTGSNNVIGTGSSNTKSYGNNQQITISQIGNNNVAALNIQGNNSTVLSTVTGSLNNLTIDCGAGQGNLNSCNDSNITANATGDSNNMTVTSGGKNLSNSNITGDTNNLTITSGVDNSNNLIGSKSEVTVIGGLNSITLVQDGVAGGNGHDAKVQVTGDSNQVGVYQGGATDSKVDIKSLGNSNTITVRSNHN